MSLKKVWLLLIVLFIGSGSIRAIDSVNAAGAGSLRLGVNDKLTTIEAVSVKIPITFLYVIYHRNLS